MTHQQAFPQGAQGAVGPTGGPYPPNSGPSGPIGDSPAPPIPDYARGPSGPALEAPGADKAWKKRVKVDDRYLKAAEIELDVKRYNADHPIIEWKTGDTLRCITDTSVFKRGDWTTFKEYVLRDKTIFQDVDNKAFFSAAFEKIAEDELKGTPLEKETELERGIQNEVDHPPHYTQGSIECIDAIEAALGRDGFIAFLRGQVIKYTWRTGLKGDASIDAKKAAWYQARLVKTLEKSE